MYKMAENLRTLRISAGYSQKELAELSGVTNQSTVAKIENGKGEATNKLLRWYADHFDVSLDWIFGRCEKPQGKLYNYEPDILRSKMENKEEWAQFVKACFEPNSALNAKLQEAILRLSTGGEGE
ncbi:MAG: helix-turn-helix domain-containing protein [Oscillospiraceae bacterium]|nr:helix-turn-helix domain-containing protein [Oscillospiraceae bacterium]